MSEPVELTEAEMDAVELADILGRLLHSGGLARTAARHSLMKALEGWVSPKRVKAREAAARREALLEAADDLEPLVANQHPTASLNPEVWLRDRAFEMDEPERDKEVGNDD